MKHKEAIEIIKKLRDGLYKLKEYGAERYLIEVSVDYYKKFEDAVSVLEQEPCDDAISREDAEQMFRNIRSHLKPQDYKTAEEFNTRDLMLLNAEQMIHALPSVTQKSGKWIWCVGSHKCSNCEEYTCFSHKELLKYCPNCGAKMESEDKE